MHHSFTVANLPESSSGPNSIQFGTTDDSNSLNLQVGGKKKKKMKKSIKINVSLDTVSLQHKQSISSRQVERMGTINEKDNETTVFEGESRISQRLTNIDVDAINSISQHLEYEEKIKKEEQAKIKKVNSMKPTKKKLEPLKSFEFQVFDSKTLLQPAEPKIRKLTTNRNIDEDKSPNSEEFTALKTENQKLKTYQRTFMQFKKAKLHIGFLFASPFCFISNTHCEKNHYQMIPPLHVQNEVKHIKAAAKDAQNGIIFKCAVATQKNFVQMLAKSPKMLHISCHGIPNNANTLKQNYWQHQHEGDYLLFEHEQLIGEMVSEKSLRNLITNVWETELVFLAACDSEFAGKIFLKKGVKHVICIQERKEVLDSAVNTFMNTFYQYVFEGKAICEAFLAAQKFTSNIHHEREAAIFKLLKNGGDHECVPIQFNAEQKFKNTTDKILVCEIPAKIDNLLFREKEMAKLIQKIMESQRLVFIFGLLGIGKSWIARNVMQFMKERKYFCGGLIFLSLNGTRTITAVCRQLYGLIVKNLVENGSNNERLQIVLDKTSETIDFFVDFFNHENNYAIKKVDRYQNIDFKKNDRTKKFLVCLDNAQDLIEAEPQEFKQLIKRLLNACPNLQIMITSRRHLFKIDDSVDPDFMFIPELKGTKPVELFLHKAERFRSIPVDEIIEIIKMDKSFDIAGFSKNQIKDLDSPEGVKKLQLLLRQQNKVIEALKQHDLFKQFAGNPLSITKLAVCYSNPQTKQSLPKLYQLMLEGKLELERLDEDGTSVFQSKVTETKNTNSISLQLATRSSIELLHGQSQEAESLLYFLSLLPNGVKLEQLNQMWAGAEKHIEIIQIYEFLEMGQGDNYTVIPFVINYLNQTMQMSDKEVFIDKICTYYCELLKRLFGIISLADTPAHDTCCPNLAKSPINKGYSFLSFGNHMIRPDSEKESMNTSHKFQQCLLSHLRESPSHFTSVLEDSLNQILNIENTLEMLIVRDSVKTKSPLNTSNNSSFKTEIISQDDISSDSDEIIENEEINDSRYQEDFTSTMLQSGTSLGSLGLGDVTKKALPRLIRRTSESQKHKQRSQLREKMPRKNKSNLLVLNVEEVDSDSEDDSSPAQQSYSQVLVKRQNIRENPQIIDGQSSKVDSRKIRIPHLSSIVENNEEGDRDGITSPVSITVSESIKTSPATSEVSKVSKIFRRIPTRLSKKSHGSLGSSSTFNNKTQFKMPIRLGQNVREELSDSESDSSEEIMEHFETQLRKPSKRISSDMFQNANSFSPIKKFGTIIEQRRVSFTKSNTILESKFQNSLIPKENQPHFARSLSKATEDPLFKDKQEIKIRKMEESNNLTEICAKKRSLLMILQDRKKPSKKNSGNPVSATSNANKQLNNTESFILYAIAVMYLSSSFRLCLNICTSKFKAMSDICNANILRFKALTLEQMALKSPFEMKTNAAHLSEAVQAVKGALKLYEAAEFSQQACFHGVALCQFQLGFLYSNYQKFLLYKSDLDAGSSETLNFAKSCTETINKQSRATAQFKSFDTKSQAQALGYFKKALQHFTMINHYKGCEFTCQQILELDGTDLKWQNKMRQYAEQYEVYLKNKPEKLFLARKQGEAVSLMTELVVNSSNVYIDGGKPKLNYSNTFTNFMPFKRDSLYLEKEEEKQEKEIYLDEQFTEESFKDSSSVSGSGSGNDDTMQCSVLFGFKRLQQLQ